MRPDLFGLHAELEERHWWFLGRRRIMRRLVHAVLPPHRGHMVVDVGCGAGANIGALAHEYECIGVDVSPEAIELARGRFPGVRFVRGSVPDDLGAAAGAARLFLIMDVLEHVEDDGVLLSDILGASRPGAHVLLTVPADPSQWSEHDVSFGHYRRYEADSLRGLWAGLPVTVRLFSHFNSRLYLPIKAIRTMSRLRGRASGRAGTDLRVLPRPVNAALAAVFAGEADALCDALDSGRQAYARGVSLVALLRREQGASMLRAKPGRA